MLQMYYIYMSQNPLTLGINGFVDTSNVNYSATSLFIVYPFFQPLPAHHVIFIFNRQFHNILLQISNQFIFSTIDLHLNSLTILFLSPKHEGMDIFNLIYFCNLK